MLENSGDRVGWGYGHGSCRQCRYCLRGDELYCPQRKIYGESSLDQGSFAHAAVFPEDFLYKIPDGLTNAEVAPLMCAGSAVFSPLHKFKVAPTDRVGVIGVGGWAIWPFSSLRRWPLDHLLVTSAAQPNWDAVFRIMAPGGSIYALTVDMVEMRFPYLPVVMKGLRIQGSLPAARGSQREMLQFAVRHSIKPIEAMESLMQGKMRYRGVLVHDV
ncbi:chaperonin 10-like protein [Aspergillus californicus]